MPRTPDVRIVLTARDKAFMYSLLKNIAMTLPKRDEQHSLMRLVVKFTPGTQAISIRESERQVVVAWLIKLYKIASTREDSGLGTRLNDILDKMRHHVAS